MVGEMARMARAKASPRSRQSRNWPKLGPVGDSRTTSHPAWPIGTPPSRRPPGPAVGDAREGEGPNQVADAGVGLSVCRSLVRAGLPAFAGELAVRGA